MSCSLELRDVKPWMDDGGSRQVKLVGRRAEIGEHPIIRAKELVG
jgi:hypothetical protein